MDAAMADFSWLVGQPAHLAQKNWTAKTTRGLSITTSKFTFNSQFDYTDMSPNKMPAPTALVHKPREVAEDVAMEAVNVPLPAEDDTELIDMSLETAPTATDAPAVDADDTLMVDETGRPKFAPAKSIPLAFRREQRKVPIPPHRMTPLKAAWPKIYV